MVFDKNSMSPENTNQKSSKQISPCNNNSNTKYNQLLFKKRAKEVLSNSINPTPETHIKSYLNSKLNTPEVSDMDNTSQQHNGHKNNYKKLPNGQIYQDPLQYQKPNNQNLNNDNNFNQSCNTSNNNSMSGCINNNTNMTKHTNLGTNEKLSILRKNSNPIGKRPIENLQVIVLVYKKDIERWGIECI